MLLRGRLLSHHASRDLGQQIHRALALGPHIARSLSRAGLEVTPAGPTELTRLPEAAFDLVCSESLPAAPGYLTLEGWACLVRPGGLVRVISSVGWSFSTNTATRISAEFMHARLVDVEQYRRGGLLSTTGRRPAG